MTDDLGALIREALPSFQTPDELRAWARERARLDADAPSAPPAAQSAGRTRTSFRIHWPSVYAAGLVVAALLGWSAERLGRDDSAMRSRDALVAQLVDTHVRSLMVDHLTDVRSTDQHTVKPWFVGKADMAPRVVDLASSGFPLVGGRLDYVQGRTAVTLVYERRRHVVNLFMWPDAVEKGVTRAAYHGFALMHWSAAGMSYWAVSDAAPAELDAFQHAYASAP